MIAEMVKPVSCNADAKDVMNLCRKCGHFLMAYVDKKGRLVALFSTNKPALEHTQKLSRR